MYMAKALAEPEGPRIRISNLAHHAHDLADTTQDLPSDVKWARRKSLGRIFCVMQVGGARTTVDELYSQLDEVVKACHGVIDGPPVLMNLQPPSAWVYPNIAPESWLMQRAERSVVVGEFAIAHGLPFVDLNPGFAEYRNSDPAAGIYDGDGVHPGPRGHDIIAKAVKAEVDTLTAEYSTAQRWLGPLAVEAGCRAEA
jgi:lysophospholipase L1-like esterase